MRKISEKVVFRGKWLSLKESLFVNRNDEQVTWEIVERTRPNLVVVVLAKLVPSNRFVLIRQFRHTLDGSIIGFPAGIIELGRRRDPDAVRREALRELREETGYLGRITGTSPPLKTHSGIMDQESLLLRAEIDETLPENRAPVQELEPGEEIEVILKKRESIRDFLLEEHRRGTLIGPGIWYLFGEKPGA
jgi:ADP-ribose pyrophosphatase